MTASCKRHGIDPFRYLADVLRRLRTTPPDHITELLPDEWFKTYPPRQLENGPRRLKITVRSGDNLEPRTHDYEKGTRRPSNSAKTPENV